MKIERVSVHGFGKLSGVDSGPEPLGQLVVVLGPNEAGKSTLFHFLTTALYGFQPASREGNPYTPWGSDEASGEVHLRLDSGESAHVLRRLRSQPAGTLTMGDRGDDLRNRPLPWVGHVPRSVFRQVFAVTLSELAGLDDETWARIQDRILGSMGATDLEPARVVADELEKQAGESWRPQNRGNQKVRDIQATIRDLRGRRRSAVERDRDIRRAVADQARADLRLETARREREESRIRLERMERLVPVRNQLTRVAALRQEGGDRADLADLPADPARVLTEFRERLHSLHASMQEIDADAAEPQAVIAAFDGTAQERLQHRSAIEGVAARVGAESERHRAGIIRREIGDNEARLERLADEVLEQPWSAVSPSALRALNIGTLRDHLRGIERAQDEGRLLADQNAPAPEAPAPDRRVPGLLIGLGLVALVAGGLLPQPVLSLVGAAFVAVGGTLLFLEYRRESAPVANVPPLADRLEAVRAREAAAQRAFAEQLGEIPVDSRKLTEPSESLITTLEKLRDGVRDTAARREELEGLRSRVASLDREVASVAAEAGLTPSTDSDATVTLMERALRDAERRRDAADAAERELARLERTRARIHADRLAIERDAADLTERLAGLASGDIEEGTRVAHARVDAHGRADQLEEELVRQHSDLDDLRRRIAEAERSGEEWDVDDAELANRRTGIAALSDEIEQLARSTEAMGRDIAHLRLQETVDQVDGEIATLEEEEERLVRERDRRWVLAQVIRQADRAFREEHQPDLLRVAGRHLSRLTRGKYDHIVVDEGGAGDTFQVMGPGLAAPIPLTSPVSTGTLEQAYLSLRLAIVDHLDEGGERLPLFIDEAFVNWDRDRRGRGIELLEAVAETRQLLFFTCHPRIAEQLTNRGAHLVRLERAPGADQQRLLL